MLEKLLLEALELPEVAWPEFLDRRCEGRPDLRRELESLLYIGREALQRASRPLFEFLTLETSRPDHLGPFEVLQEIATGGMATVYLGRRADGSDPRPVALKVLRPGLATPELRRCLQREGEVLANLRHPFIAVLAGGGISEDGSPFLVMEYVDGLPLDRWVEATAPSLKERLSLFVRICDAMRHAHGRLVIHGDLKPSNILVVQPIESEPPEPRLLDFGIAKILDPESDRPRTLTATGRRMLTPEYASPEQIRHRLLTTATDVYSLGVILFELLTGRRPFELGDDPVDRLRTICEIDPPSPSTVASNRRPTAIPSRHLAGDLDAIVLKALRKEPERRYDSVARLADDVEHHLAGRPVSARRGTFTYRAGKFLRRHRLTLGSVALILLMLASFFLDRERQRQRIARERDKAEEVQAFLLELFLSADPAGRNLGEISLREMLDRGSSRLAQLDTHPEVRASFMGALGEVYGNFGELDRAAHLLDEALELEKRWGTGLTLGITRRRLGAILKLRDEFQRADRVLKAAVADLEEVERGEFELALALNELGLLRMDQARPTDARQDFERALEIFDDLGLEDHPEATSVHNNLGLLAYGEGRYPDAVEIWDDVLAKQRAHFGDEHASVATAYNNLAAAHLALGDLGSAERGFRRAADIQKEILGEDHALVLTSWINLAALLERLDRNSEARQLLETVVDGLRRSGQTEGQLMQVSLNNLGNLLSKAGEWETAETSLRESLALSRKIHGADHPQVARTLANVGRLYARSGRRAEARRELATALDLLRRALGEGHTEVAELSRDLEEL